MLKNKKNKSFFIKKNQKEKSLPIRAESARKLSDNLFFFDECLDSLDNEQWTQGGVS